MMQEQKRRPHQQRILDQNPNKAVLVWSPRSGKSKAGEDWINHPDRGNNTYVICLKKNKKEWIKRAPNATVYTKEELKKYFSDVKNPTALLIDELHYCLSPLFIAKKRSQLTTCVYTLIKKYPDMHLMGLTGTPLTNDPASCHTLLTYIGHYIEWKKYREKFYELKYLPFMSYPAYMPVKNWRGMANELLVQYTDIVSLHDCVDSLPPVINEVVEVKTKPKVYEEDEEYHWTKSHKHEQLEKYKYIKELNYRKLILVCHYTEQIDELADKLKSEKPVFILDGRTKNQEDTIAQAQQESDCYLIVQSSCGESWDGYYFDAMIFVSMSHTVKDHTQMVSRLDTIQPELMKPKIYYYYVFGKWDCRIYDSIMSGEDFNIHKYKD